MCLYSTVLDIARKLLPHVSISLHFTDVTSDTLVKVARFNSASIRTGPDLSVSEAAPVYTGCLDLFCFQHWEKSLSVWLYVCFDPIPSERRTLSLFICFPDWHQMTHAFSKHKFHSFGSFSTFHYYCAQKDFTQKVRCSCVIVKIRCHLCVITWNVLKMVQQRIFEEF